MIIFENKIKENLRYTTIFLGDRRMFVSLTNRTETSTYTKITKLKIYLSLEQIITTATYYNEWKVGTHHKQKN